MSYKCNRKYLKDALLKAGKLVQQMNVLRPVFKRLHEYKPAELLLQFYTSGCNYFKHLTVQKTDLKGKELNSPRLIKGFHFALDLKINFKHASLVILLKNLHYRVLKKNENVKLHEFSVQHSWQLVKRSVDLLLQKCILLHISFYFSICEGY